MKKIMAQALFFTIIMSNISFASIYDLEVNAGRSALEARFNATLPLEKGFFTTGIGAVYNNDDYKIGDMKLALSKEILLPELMFSFGLKGLWGNIEEDNKDGDLMAIGLAISGKYIISEKILPFPVAISAGLSLAPDSLSFLDSDRYLDIRASLDCFIVENGAIVLGYRYIEVHLDDNDGYWEMSDETLFVGYQIKY
ncbi:MAG TPA: YfaZ family outer membrane protein [Desulfatiglandales bacterium]|nr:YfaZ family outer membrane protein [Desulfatiglandales bacterium]